MDEYLVVGIGFYVSKNNTDYRVLHLSQAFTDSKYGIGAKTSQEFVKTDIAPKGLKPGDTVRLTYGRSFKGQAYVNGVHIVEGDVPTVEVKK